MSRGSLLQAAWQMDKKYPLVVLLLLLLNIAAVVCMQSYVSPRVERLEKKYIEAQAQIRLDRVEKHTAQQEPQGEFWAAKEELQSFWQAIPPRSQFTALIEELFTLAGGAGLEIDQISYNPEEVKGRNLLRYGLVFSVNGDYGQIKQFIHSLEQTDRLISIEDLSLSSSEEQHKQRVRLSLRLSTLFRTGDL